MRPENYLRRLWAKVNKTDTCWLWTGAQRADGYGRICFRGRDDGIHRVVYTLLVGEIPAGAVIRHSCDVRLCVNPAHLSTGMIADNVHDAVERGRHIHGEAMHTAKIKVADVKEIRSLYAAKKATRHQLAERFGLTHSAVCMIIKRRRWKSVA